jgi:hypothetical protein
MTNQRKVPSGYRIDADKKKWLQENGGITPLIDRALEEAGYFEGLKVDDPRARLKGAVKEIFDVFEDIFLPSNKQ